MFELEGSLAGGVGLGDCRTVKMGVAAVEVVEEIVTEGMDFKNGVEDEDKNEDEEVKARVLEESRDAISCSGDAASKVSSVGFEQSSPSDP